MTVVLDQAHELRWGGVVFASDAEVDTPYRFEALVGTAYGNPVSLTAVVRSSLGDGELIRRTGWGNREDVPVYVRVSAHDGQSLAMGEAALAQEFMADDPNPLTWVPPTLGAWPLAFDVLHVEPERDWQGEVGASWDYRERFDHQIVYKLTFTTAPFTRDLEPTLIPALDVPANPDEPVLIDLDTCDSADGWVRTYSPSTGWTGLTGVTQSAGAVRVNGNRTGDSWLALERTFATPISMDGTPYLVVALLAPDDGHWPARPGVTVVYDTAGGQPFKPVAMKPHPTVPHRYDVYFGAPESFSRVKIRAQFTTFSPAARYLYVHNVARTDRVAIDGANGLQVARTAVIGGTAPTQAKLRLDAAGSPLVGSTAMFYTGASPVVPLRARLSNADTLAGLTVDATKISGATNGLTVAMVFRIPVPLLARATYGLLARLSFTGTRILSWSAKLVDSTGADIPGSDVESSGTTLLRNPTSDPWRIHHIASMKLPAIATEGVDSDVVQITLGLGGAADVAVDEAWIANTEDGAITLVHEPSANALTSIELRSPTISAPFPSVYGTWSSGRTQDITRLARIGTHRFKPGRIHIFTATDLARFAGCELEYFRRYFLLAGPDLPSPDTDEDAAA